MAGRKRADEVMILALACGATMESAAQKAAVSLRTAYRRLLDPVFRQRITQVRTELLDRTAGLLAASSVPGVKTLIELLGVSYPPAVRLGSSRTILEQVIKVREHSEFAKRIAALEQREQASPPANETSGVWLTPPEDSPQE